MRVNTLDLARWNRISAALGGAAWIAITLARLSGWVGLSDLELLLLLALFVITPLAIPLATGSKEHRTHCRLLRLVIVLQPFAALIGGVSFLLGDGLLAAFFASVWLLFTGLLALISMVWLFQKSSMSLADACITLAFIYLPIGGVWFVLERLGARPLGFSPATVLLTAVHFHFITLAALIMTGLTGRAIRAATGEIPRRVYCVAAMGMVVEPLLVAAGITLTQVTGMRVLESSAAVLLAFSLMVISLLGIYFVVPATPQPLARWLLRVSSLAVLVTMLFAGAYALGAASGAWTITISQMIAVHGWLNAVVFGFCGLLGWRLKAKLPDLQGGMQHARHHYRRDGADWADTGRDAGRAGL